MTERLRLTEILTTSSAVANYLGVPNVRASHLLLAIELLSGKKSMDDLGRPQSPMIARMTGAGSGVDPDVQRLSQRWFSRLARDPLAELTEPDLDELVAELAVLDSLEGSSTE
jgi:hypothetical protein